MRLNHKYFSNLNNIANSSPQGIMKVSEQVVFGFININMNVKNARMTYIVKRREYINTTREYAYTMRLAMAASIYSFGDNLLELLTGKPSVSILESITNGFHLCCRSFEPVASSDVHPRRRIQLPWHPGKILRLCHLIKGADHLAINSINQLMSSNQRSIDPQNQPNKQTISTCDSSAMSVRGPDGGWEWKARRAAAAIILVPANDIDLDMDMDMDGFRIFS
uniref:Uncharacterized protein n=1 Tax=Oryza barthii TaxID=65489 RepID=A0A0D3FKS7_9ORYZ